MPVALLKPTEQSRKGYRRDYHLRCAFAAWVTGFRALAHVNGHHCQLISRNGHRFRSWPYLAEEIAHAVRANKRRARWRDRLSGY